MKLHEGRSGTQEIACLAGMSVGIMSLFGIDSQTLYLDGNISYITIPIAIIISLAGAFIAMSALKSGSGVNRGGILIKLAAVIEAILLILAGIMLLSRFTHAVHYHIFGQSGYERVVVWTVLTIALVTVPGFETISRTARCICMALVLLLVATLAVSSEGSEIYRLSPFPGKGIKSAATETWALSALLLPGIAAIMFFPKSANGYCNARKGTLVGALTAAVTASAAQLVLGMAYAYTELRDIFLPLYELNMILPSEGYFMRYDKLLLFIWLIGALVVCAYYAYSAGNILCRVSFGSDARPAVLALCALLGAAVLFIDKNAWIYELIKKVFPWASAGLAAMLACAGVINAIRYRRGKNAKTV